MVIRNWSRMCAWATLQHCSMCGWLAIFSMVIRNWLLLIRTHICSLRTVSKRPPFCSFYYLMSSIAACVLCSVFILCCAACMIDCVFARTCIYICAVPADGWRLQASVSDIRSSACWSLLKWKLCDIDIALRFWDICCAAVLHQKGQINFKNHYMFTCNM